MLIRANSEIKRCMNLGSCYTILDYFSDRINLHHFALYNIHLALSLREQILTFCLFKTTILSCYYIIQNVIGLNLEIAQCHYDFKLAINFNIYTLAFRMQQWRLVWVFGEIVIKAEWLLLRRIYGITVAQCKQQPSGSPLQKGFAPMQSGIQPGCSIYCSEHSGFWEH